jgi:RecA-family ATPase
VVDRILPTGLGLLGGTAKMGKSMFALDLALTVAMGGHAFSGLACQQGDVLYLSLDSDSDARIAERAAYLMGRPAYVSNENITLHTSWPQGREALTCCQEWAEEVRNPLLIVLDTLVRVEPEFEGNGRGSAYQASVDVLTRWAQFAQAADLAVLAVHHTRKGASEDLDWIDRFLGSRGIVATAQTLWMLDAERGADEGLLRVAGRDVAHQDLAIHRNGWTWQVQNPPRPIMQVVSSS